MADVPTGSASGHEPGSRPVRPRWTFILVQSAWFPVLHTLLKVTGRAEAVYQQTEISEVPLPTDLFLALADFLRLTGTWMLMGGVLAIGVLALLTLRGHLDPQLRRLIVANLVILSILAPAWAVSVLLPISGSLGMLFK